MNTVAKRNFTQNATLDELQAEAEEAYEDGDTLKGDLLLFSARHVALATWNDPMERARRTWSADPSELDWR